MPTVHRRAPCPPCAILAGIVLPLCALAACAATSPQAAAPAHLPPLARVCQDALPLAPRTVGELVRFARTVNPNVLVASRPCRAGTAWPIAYATHEDPSSGRPLIGFSVLRMEGDALLTFDTQDRDLPTVNLCRALELRLDDDHRVRAVALWNSSDENAFDAERPADSHASIAFLEVISRRPSECALGRTEPEGEPAHLGLRAALRCAALPVVADRPGCAEPEPLPPIPVLDGVTLDRLLAETHRVTGEGRAAPADFDGEGALGLRPEHPERCAHEPAPAARDTCHAVYLDAAGARWYGRADVTRTGEQGDKNYVDSYLTFQLLRRLEGERRSVERSTPPAR